MSNNLTLRDVEKLILEDSRPLNFGRQMPTYRAAIRRLAKLGIPSLQSVDPWRVYFNREAIEGFFAEQERCFSNASRREQHARGQWRTRLRQICKRLDGTVATAITPDWARLCAAVEDEASIQGMDPRHFIPLVHSLKTVAIEHDLEPNEITRHWLTEVASRATPERRKALCQASKQLDEMRNILPPDLHTIECPISPLSLPPSGQRKGRPLPPRVKKAIQDYVACLIAGKIGNGVNGPTKIGQGINEKETAPSYEHAFAWYRDCLIELELMDSTDDSDIRYFGDLTHLRVVVVESLADIDRSQEGDPTVFPWKPISCQTLKGRLGFLIKACSELIDGYLELSVPLVDGDAQHTRVTARGLLRIVNARIPKSLTPKAEAFCRKVVTDENSRALLLHLHTITFAEAQSKWVDFENQVPTEQCKTLSLCALAAMTAITTSFPFRRRTLVSLALHGEDPDVYLPKNERLIIFNVSGTKMKAKEGFDGTIRDSSKSQPRRILDWFLAGPRQAILNHGQFLSPDLSDGDLLFCGISRERYGNSLSAWTEEVGIKMTTHLFRHAIASILINNLDCSLQQVAAMLGNTVATVETNYLFLDKVSQRKHAIARLNEAREIEIPNILHSRMRGKRS